MHDKNHKLPDPNPDFCSCCRKAIIHAYQNTVRINQRKSNVLDLDGKFLGTEGHDRPKACFHSECASLHYPETLKIVECKYCGVFVRAKTLKDGTPIKDSCKCSCHTNWKYCSLLVAA